MGMLVLPLAYYAIFCYWPMYGVQMAFRDFKVRTGMMASPWVGLKHFKDFLSDAYFWKLVRNTLALNLWGLLLGFPAPIVFALLLNELQSNVLRRIAQTITYLPHFISTVVVCAMVTNFFAVNGAVNDILQTLIGRRLYFLTTPQYFRPIYTLSGIWQSIGWGSIIYMAALTNVDVQLYEAAVIDGANRWQQMLSVTLPAIVPTISIMLILQIGGMMGVGLEKVLLLYNGSVYETADVIATYVYRRGLVDAKFSYATAVGVFQSVIGLILLSGANRFSSRFSESSLW
jgi:putative aldouronate transport system permease protein